MAQIVMKDDPDKLNPLQGLGHFVCVDGFGPVSKEERAAGLPGHGEAHRVPWDVVSSEKTGATIGGPFLEQGKTVSEMSARRASTRSYASEAVDPPDHHNLADDKEFMWPMAPTVDGSLIDVRIAPTITPVMDQTTSLMDPSRRLVYVVSFHPGKQALFGYVFRREEYPWTQMWDSYQGEGKRSSRGMEFAAQPYDLPRREVIESHAMFDTPAYRWLPAKSTIGTSFVMFYTRTPDGFTQVDDVVLENGTLTIEDRAAGKKIVLKASRGL